MDVIRDSAFFTTLLHCALAYSLYPYDLGQKPVYDVSSIPGSGILQTPSYNRNPDDFVTPAWQNRPLENGLLQVSKNPPYLYKQLGFSIKNDGTQYPLSMPGRNNGEVPMMYPSVFNGQNGAAVKNIGSGENPVDIYPSNLGLYHNVPQNIAPTQSYQEMHGFVLKPVGLDYPSAAPGPIKDAFPYTPYKPNQYGVVNTPDYNVNPVTKPVTPLTPEYKDKSVMVSDLPAVPNPPLPQLQRIRIALMNTVAGLPGGSTELLNSIRA